MRHRIDWTGKRQLLGCIVQSLTSQFLANITTFYGSTIAVMCGWTSSKFLGVKSCGNIEIREDYIYSIFYALFGRIVDHRFADFLNAVPVCLVFII